MADDDELRGMLGIDPEHRRHWNSRISKWGMAGCSVAVCQKMFEFYAFSACAKR